MGVRILTGDWHYPDSEDQACFYCSTSGVAFGPMMQSEDEAEMFLKYLGVDPRQLTDKELMEKFSEFRSATVECSICRENIPYSEYYLNHYDSHPCE